jgi:hypothetical protein
MKKRVTLLALYLVWFNNTNKLFIDTWRNTIFCAGKKTSCNCNKRNSSLH